MPSLLVLVAGPYRSGTGDDPNLIQDNLRRMHQAALALFRAGHLPVVSEDLALPLAALAGSQRVGDEAFDAVFHPFGRRIVERCDAVLRLPGPSKGSDQMVLVAREHGIPVFGDVADVPAAEAPAPVPGVNVPDARGRTGLDRAGRDLSGNPDVVVRDVTLLSSDWHVLRRTNLDYRHGDGRWTRERRETYDRGNGATILLYDPERRTVLLGRQFRYPAYVNGSADGMLLEAAAGLLDEDDAETAVRREVAEELGVAIGEVTPVFEVWMSPGSVTERLHFFAASYTRAQLTTERAGVVEEGEDIEVVELPFLEALAMTTDGRIADAKTIMLLQWAALHGPFRGPVSQVDR